jgi:phage terminase large subunit-like protein
VLVFPPQDEADNYVVLPYFWIPEENVSLRVRRDHVPYDVWQKQGFLHTTEGNVVHYGYIEKFIETMGEQYNIREIAFDRWGAVQMVQKSRGDGIYRRPVRAGVQGYESSHQGTDEADAGKEDRPRRTSGIALDDGQYLHQIRSGRQYQAG